jgi:TonB family protein
MIEVAVATIKASVIVVVALAATRIMRRRSAALRHSVLAVAVACAATIPLLGPVTPSWHVDLGIGATVAAPTATLYTGGAAISGSPTEGNEAQTVIAFERPTGNPGRPSGANALVLLWMAGLAAGLGLLIVGVCRLRWLESRSRRVVTGPWVRIAEDVARRHGLARPPILLESERPALLVTWGVRRPRIILPADARTWTDDRIRVVLAHEIAHVVRRDWLLQTAAEVVRCVYWFNPILWIACAQMRQESEQACDDTVLQAGIDGRVYAGHLLEIARVFRRHRAAWVPAAAIAHRSSLERRVCAMLNSRVDRKPVTPPTALAVIAALVSITIPIAGLSVFAQTRFATVSGTATDETGAVLVNATLALSNVRTQAKYEVRTDRSGAFEFVGLPAGDYAFEARVLGFEPLKEDVTVGVGESLQKNVALKIGTVQETITVTADREQQDASRQGSRLVTARAPRPRPCPNPAVGGCIGPPLKLKDVRPVYPPALRESAMQGTVSIEGQIGTDGRMKDMRVLSSPHPAFERAALDAVGEWEFTPTTLNGRVVDTRINVSVSFAPAQSPAAAPPQ